MHEKDQRKKEDILFLTCNVQEISLDENWYLDNGCSNHMRRNKGVFVNLDELIESEVRRGDDKRLLVKGSGDILIKSKENIKCISNVFYVPNLKHNILNIE